MKAMIKHVNPPHLYNIELRTIGALLSIGHGKDERVQHAMLELYDGCFHNQNLKQLFILIHNLFMEGKEFSLVSIIDNLPFSLHNYVMECLKDEYYTSNTLKNDVDNLVKSSILRKQLVVLVDTVNKAIQQTNQDVSLDVISNSLRQLNQTMNFNGAQCIRTYSEIAEEILNIDGKDNSTFKVNIPHLPEVPNQALITIAGRSGHGKTFFALYLMNAIMDAKPDKQAMFFNLEMHEQVMVERHSLIVGTKGATRKERIKNALPKLLEKNVQLVSVPMITIDEIETQSRLAALRKPLSVIVVDYLGLIRTKTKSERKDLDQSDIAKRLAALSLELDCTVIALIQVNRDFKNKPVGDRCPQPQDSAESMGSVHSSSWWIGIDQPQTDSDDPQFKDLFIVKCRKNRGDSGLFSINLKFLGGTFSEYKRPFSANYVKPQKEFKVPF